MLLLNKCLPVLALPIGVVFLLLLLALWQQKRWPAVLATVVLYLSSISVTGNALISLLESRYPPVPIAQAGTGDAIVVLSGIFGPAAQPGYLVNLGESVERLEGGIVLCKTAVAPWLVFTGGRIPWEGQSRVEGEVSRDAAIARGVPAEKLLVTGEASNTADEARAVAELVRIRGWKRVILVTTAWHMPRAVWLFRRAGVECSAFPVDFRVDPGRTTTLLDFLPNARALADTETALREVYGNLFYRVVYAVFDFDQA